MLRVRPFRGVRFDPRRAPLSRALCPPYDVISPALERRLRGRKVNAIHLELPGGRGEARYRAAARTWGSWSSSGVLIRDEVPAFYAVEQSFLADGRRARRLGLLASLGLDEASSRRVMAHERTLAKPKEDRIRLLSAVGVNTSPIFCVFADSSRSVEKLLRAARHAKPAARGRDAQGVFHRLWRIDDPDSVSRLQRLFSGKRLLIADGHHRYEVAREFSRGRGAALPGAGGILAYLCSEEDPGLIVHPTHRVLSVDASVRARLSAHCAARIARSLPALEAALARDRSPYAFGLVDGEFLLMRPAHGDSGVTSGFGTDWLARRILAGVDPRDIRFVHDSAEAVEEAQSAGKAAFLLRSFPVRAIRQAVQRAGLLPQKSTYFFPKIGTGLVFRVLDE